MKNLLLILFIVSQLTACIKEPDVHVWQLRVVADFDESHRIQGAQVSLINQLKSYSVTGVTDKNGAVDFDNVEPGLYTISVVHNFDFKTYNATKDVAVFSSLVDTISLVGSTSSALLIKEYYFSGSATLAGKLYYSDQYIEIFNNSSVVQYADGLSILEHESYGTGENYWKSIKDSIVVKMIWSIPGSGRDVPMQPGESLILATNGIDHQKDPKGNPNSPVNLSDANFEFFVKSDTDDDLDVIQVDNLLEDLFVYRAQDVTFHSRGGSAIALAKLRGNNTEERCGFINSMLVTKEARGGSNVRHYAKIPNNMILDAVETVFDDAHAQYKRFPVSLDAGYTFVSLGNKSGKCVRRKIKETINGRTVYQDTDNSSVDFVGDADPNPRRND